MLVFVKGAGDLATGVAYGLHHAGFKVVMSDLERPTSIRRTVCFSEAIVNGSCQVEGITAVRAYTPEDIERTLSEGFIPVIADEKAEYIKVLKPDVVVDAILAKKNIGTSIDDAKIVIALGPGFTAGKDCDAVIETMRGHSMGRIIYQGSALENTGTPGNVGGYTIERLLRAPDDGIFECVKNIGDIVTAGDVCAYVNGSPVVSRINGVLRGLLPDGIPVFKGMKSGDVDPRCAVENCYTISDKALCLGYATVEAILHLSEAVHEM